MEKMYEPFMIGNLRIKNRIVRSAMFEYGADEGKISSRIVELYEKVAKGGSGLIITGMQSVSEGGGYGPSMIKTCYDNYVEDMKKVADVIHKYDSKVFVQLQHVGYRTNYKMGYDTFGVSELRISDECIYHEATQKEINKLIDDFAVSALKCSEAGCDGVQIHAAHGFLINSFLSPHFNHRKDIYGGSIENRGRLLFEICKAVKKAAGNDFLIGVKVPFSDLTDDGNTENEMLYICKTLENIGVDMLEISSGITMDGGSSSFTPFVKKGNEGCFLKSAKTAADCLHIPVISVCGYRTPEFIEKVLYETNIAAISLGRPLTREPDLPNRWKIDKSPAACVSCNKCFGSKNIIACQFLEQNLI